MTSFVVVFALGCAAPDVLEAPAYTSEIYADISHWTCHPEQSERFCEEGLDSTVVDAQGGLTDEPHQPGDPQEFDCFYVYPTVNMEPTPNSDLIIGEEERLVTQNQAARYSRYCRVFAPVYRQATVTSLFSDLSGDYELAYGDVLDAWRHYLANHNAGRGVLLIGHSQGAVMLSRLLREEIEGGAHAWDRLVAAHLIGATIEVPTGQLVGGDFAEAPLCTAADEARCVLGYLSFDAEDTSDHTAVFGLPEEDHAFACVHPGQLLRGDSGVTPYYPTEQSSLLDQFLTTEFNVWANPDAHPAVTTPYAKLPDWIEGRCVQQDGMSYLEVRRIVDDDDPRSQVIGGAFLPGWGLHLVDMNLAMEDLVELAKRQHTAWMR